MAILKGRATALLSLHEYARMITLIDYLAQALTNADQISLTEAEQDLVIRLNAQLASTPISLVRHTPEGMVGRLVNGDDVVLAPAALNLQKARGVVNMTVPPNANLRQLTAIDVFKRET